MARTIVVLLATVSVAAAAYAASNTAPDAERYLLRVKVFQQASPAAEPKVLAEPNLAVTLGTEFHFAAGGQLPAKSKVGDFSIGTQIDGLIEKVGDGDLQMTLSIRVADAVAQADNAAFTVVSARTVAIRGHAKLRETARFRCGGGWCEIGIEPLGE